MSALNNTQDSLQVARITALKIATAQAIVGSAAPICIALGGLAGHYLLAADKTFATLPITGFNIGVAAGALPAALLMRAIGRRYGFISGSLITAIGGAIAALSLFQGNFWLFAIGLLVIGVGGAFVQQYRFAAADASPSSFKPQAISWVLGGGVFAAIIGPQAVIWTKDLFAPVMFAGSFIAVVALGFLGVIVLSSLKDISVNNAEINTDDGVERPIKEIIKQPRFLVGFACGVTTYASMAFVMTGAPLAMVACGFSSDLATLGISWHVLAMFAPSFVTGKLIARYGVEKIISMGLVLIVLSAIIALLGIELWNFWLGLILLGVGWNFGFIGSTTLITQTYKPCEKNKVQGLHDFVLFTTVAIASLASGATLNIYGWDILNWVVQPVCVVCLIMIVYLLPKKPAHI